MTRDDLEKRCLRQEVTINRLRAETAEARLGEAVAKRRADNLQRMCDALRRRLERSKADAADKLFKGQ